MTAKNGSRSKNNVNGENIFSVLINNLVGYFLFRKWHPKYKIKLITLIVTTNEISEIGFEIPTKGYKKFINTPVNIRNDRLSPTEYKIASIVFILYNLRILRTRIPGMNDK